MANDSESIPGIIDLKSYSLYQAISFCQRTLKADVQYVFLELLTYIGGVFKAHQAVYFLMVDYPEMLPGNFIPKVEDASVKQEKCLLVS